MTPKFRLKRVRDIPLDGQFVVSWVHIGLPWCDAFMWSSSLIDQAPIRRLLRYDSDDDTWVVYHLTSLMTLVDAKPNHILVSEQIGGVADVE